MRKAKFVFKPVDLADVRESIREKDYEEFSYTIQQDIFVTPRVYDEFALTLQKDRKAWFNRFRGGQNPAGGIFVVRIRAVGRHDLLVDPEGFDYARYVALA